MTKPTILYEAFNARAGAQVISETLSENQVRFMVRVQKGPSTKRWLAITKCLLQLARRGAPWTIDISKQYFLMPDNEDDQRYGWRLIIQGKDLESHFATMAKAVKGMHIQAEQLDEVTLNGSPNRRVSAGYTDKVLVGPLAVRS
jgi:hypothetical protein